MISDAIRERALELHADLLEHRQEIVLIPAPDPKHTCHYIRVVQDKPPVWFSKFVNQFPKSSQRYPRPRPRVYRREVLAALLRLSRGNAATTNAERLHVFIDRMLAYELEQVPF